MRAVNNFVIIDRIKEKPKAEKTGLILTEKHQDDVRYRKAEVVSVGDRINGLNEGDIIYYDRHAGYGIEFDDKLLYVIKEHDVVVVL